MGQGKHIKTRPEVLNRPGAFFVGVYLKTDDVTGSEEFSRWARHFFAGILTYFKEK